jgi:3-phenylpropionate/trans-cinnamate dioxygenase ferredoxin component
MTSTPKYHYYKIGSIGDVPIGERILLEIDGLPIAIFNIDGELYALEDTCTHDNAPFGDGELDGNKVICPRHGARFDVRTGKALSMPAINPVPIYPVRVIDSIIEIGLPID